MGIACAAWIGTGAILTIETTADIDMTAFMMAAIIGSKMSTARTDSSPAGACPPFPHPGQARARVII